MIRAWLLAHPLEALFIAAMFGMVGALMLAHGAKLTMKAARKLRRATLGSKLLAACAGDWPAAEKVIDSARMENELLDDAVRGSKLAMSEFARRRAAFNAACQDFGDGGYRWMDVQ